MRAIVVESTEGDGTLAVVEVTRPEPGPGQVLIEVEAIGVGYVDVMARRGEYAYSTGAGAVPGLEVAGTVVGCEADAPRDLMGRSVFALPHEGGFAEFAVADATRVFRVPEELSASGAVAIGLNALVAAVALNRAEVDAGHRVLVRGAGGGIGLMATQIAAARGAEVTVVTSSLDRERRLRALGASHSVDRRKGGPGSTETYQVIVDPVAGADLPNHLSMLDINACYVLCGSAGGPPPVDPFAELLKNVHRSPILMIFSLNSVDENELQEAWTQVIDAVAVGSVHPVVHDELPLTDAARALATVERGEVFGKVVLRV